MLQRELIRLAAEALWPVVAAFVDTLPMHLVMDIPDVAVLSEYDFYALADTTELNGTINFEEQWIGLDLDRSMHGTMSTLVHELVHLVQFEDNKYNYMRHYALMEDRFGYEANPYEVQAREAGLYYHGYISKHRHIIEQLKIIWASLGPVE